MKTDYGFDGFPIRTLLICLVGAWVVYLPMLASVTLIIRVLGIFLLSLALFITFLMTKIFYYVHFGKLRLAGHILSLLNLRGDETALDVGTGRGLLMIEAAKRLPNGKSVGIDIWRQEDMKNNNPKDTLKNAEIEGVLGRVEVRNEDAQKMTFPDDSFNVVLSNLCLHNIPSKEGREKACREIARVLKSEGTAVISDTLYLEDYARVLAEEGLSVEITTAAYLEVVTPWHKILKATKS